MTAVIDITGEVFGNITVIGRSQRKSPAGALWDCQCVCGGATTTTSLKLRSGHTQSCGCKRATVSATLNLRHGEANKTATYRSWKEMRQRCLNPNSDKWKWYGGRGVSICDRWDSFENFLKDMGDRPKGCSIDRVDHDWNYEPSNCRWATPTQQAETNRGCFVPGSIPWNYGALRSVEKVKGVAAK